jgi:hypothetical protein
MRRTLTALAWARSLAARYRTHARRIPRLNAVLLRPTVAPASVTLVRHMPSYLTRHVTQRIQTSHHIAVRVAPRVSITIPSRAVTLARPTNVEDRRAAQALRAVAPVAASRAPTPTSRPAAAAASRPVLRRRLGARSHVYDPQPGPVRFTPVRRVVRVPDTRETEQRKATVANLAPTPWPDNQTASDPAAVWPPQTAVPSPPVRAGSRQGPAIDIDHVTAQVIKAIDRRAIADRERRGKA